MNRQLLLLAVCLLPTIFTNVRSSAQELKTKANEEAASDNDRRSGVRRALIIVGLAGDSEYRSQFAAVTSNWEMWLHERLGYAKENIVVLTAVAKKQEPTAIATREAISKAVDELKKASQPDDSLWVFFLGHGDYDDERARFHLPGPDFHEKELAELFTGFKCQEQVFWLTHSCSGWFLKAMARKGRVVIAASATDSEFNATEFPYALATAAIKDEELLDLNSDGRISVAELFKQTVREVNARYSADERAPTEHAQLDDNGDGKGAEVGELSEPPGDGERGEGPTLQQPTEAGVKAADGLRAAETYLPRIARPTRKERAKED